MAAASKKSRTNRTAMPAVSPLEWLGLKRAASLQILFLLGLVLASGVSVVYLTHRDRVLFTELQALREQENEIEVQWGQLLIEQSTLGLGGRVEQKATELLGMQIPQIDDIVMVVNGQAEEQ